MLRVSVEDLGDIVILSCAGRIVRGEETALLCPAVRHSGRRLRLDLSKVELIDAAGIGALIALQAAGVYLTLMNPSKPAREILRVTRLDSVFEVEETEPTPSTTEDLGERPSQASVGAEVAAPAI